ncbi:unnamed protein product [Rotaria magnacalcarata]|uniref:Uncharacterized protein n=4 Tax=Rotaria magnacalcarata TaxID=392030 RepID=A0A820I925_9BILA|nr:unnamed protein product [Rotaria magnacalcarata]
MNGGCHSSIETDSCDISDQWIETTATTEELSSSSESIKPDFVMGNKNVTSNDACSSNVNPEPIHDVQNEDKNEYKSAEYVAKLNPSLIRTDGNFEKHQVVSKPVYATEKKRSHDIFKMPKNIEKEDSRTPLNVVELLAWWYKFFLPHELTYVFDLDRRWSIFDKHRSHRIADALRKEFSTNHSNAVVQSLLAFFHSRPDIELLPRSMTEKTLQSNTGFIQLTPFTNTCTFCGRILSARDSHSRQISIVCEQGKVVCGTVFFIECSHVEKYRKSPKYIIFPNFVRIEHQHHYSFASLHHGAHVYMGGNSGLARRIITTYSCDVISNANSWWKTCDSLNLQAFNDDIVQLKPLYWKRLAQGLLMYKVLEFQLTMGCPTVIIPMSMGEFDQWAWDNYPKMLSWFIYIWSRHKYIVGSCGSDCSKAIIMNGHQKCRRRVCRYKNLTVATNEFDELMIGCCRSPLPKSRYCELRQDCQVESGTSNSVSNQCRARLKKAGLRNGKIWKKPREDGFGAAGCRTRKSKSDAYIQRCARSFGVISCVTNCRVIISFGEIFRSETLREILHLLFSTIRG